ncbi:hypothetical protein NW760_15495 [Fusarium oxysporum]|nr:hypothetical protein NW760_15495 [Fusarium oxysporum]
MRMRGDLFRTFISGASVRFDQNCHMMMARKPSFSDSICFVDAVVLHLKYLPLWLFPRIFIFLSLRTCR